MKPHIVIIGAGFGGIYTYRHLRTLLGRGARFTIVSPGNHFVFAPLLHEVATGLLEGYHIVEPIRKLIDPQTTELLAGTVREVRTETNEVVLESSTLSYDYLVVATGATSNFFGVSGAEEHSFVLKSLEDALTLRDRFITMFEEASTSNDVEEQKKLLSFVLVGGGPTGVELAAEAADLCFKTFYEYYGGELPSGVLSVTLVSSTPDLISKFPPKLREIAEEELLRKGVTLRLGVTVKEISPDGVQLEDGEMLASRTVVWTAGVTPNTVAFTPAVPLLKNNRIELDRTLRVKGLPNVFALGDVASPLVGNAPYPELAQVAVLEAKHVANEIVRAMRGSAQQEFSLHLKGELLSLGEWHAAGEIAGITIRGAFAWFVWRTVYLFKFISASKRWKIALDWTINIFTSRDITKISK